MAVPKRGYLGVEAILEGISINNPYCAHGPTLLFERFYGEGNSRRFFACSACRDRKQCPFFQWEDEKITTGKKILQEEIKSRLNKEQNQPKHCLGIDDVWCFTCSLGFCHREIEHQEHDDHNTCTLSNDNIKNPTQLLQPNENNKSNAQYFFDDETCRFLLQMIKSLHYTKIICIGTPRLFEELRLNSTAKTMLLDIDQRFGHFYGSEDFLHYNMFNNFFFNMETGKKTFKEFFQETPSDEILIIMDPPFGGLMNVLAKTLQDIWKLVGYDSLDTILIFPYFLESHVKESAMSMLKMCDYKKEVNRGREVLKIYFLIQSGFDVAYENHPSYNNEPKNKRGSPVRMFTNILLEKLKLPNSDYRFCKLCKRYVGKENRHCKMCNGCTSKDGRPYVHCNQCKQCVKSGRKHCSQCNRCQPLDHKCGLQKKNLGCHICGGNDHKRKDCPQRKSSLSDTHKRKRTSSEKEISVKKIEKNGPKANKKSKKTPRKKIRI